jgi:hypothetical protein
MSSLGVAVRRCRSASLAGAAWLVAYAGLCGPAEGRQAAQTEQRTAALDSAATQQGNALPFGITSAQLAQTVVSLTVTSTKPNSGTDEIVISGDGSVTLRATPDDAERPKEIKGRVDPVHVVRLLQLLRAEGIEQWDDPPPPGAEYVTRVLTISVNNDVRKEIVARTAFPEFSKALGAIKLLAGIARVEALGGFFQRI